LKPLLCIALVTLLLTSRAAFAAEPASANSTEDTIANTGISYGVMAGYGLRLWEHNRDIDIAQGVVHVAFPLTGPVGSSWYRGVLDYKVELQGGVITNFEARELVGLSPVGLRYNFTGAGRLVPYAEVVLGVSYFNVPRYVQGTTFNFIENAGVGAQYFMTSGTALNAQFRYMHLSNSGIREPNPGINEGFLLVGVSFY
jgi:hypothetical protein